MSKNILFIVEGEKTEPRLIEKIWRSFYPDNDEYRILSFKTNIHRLADQLFAGDNIDEDLDLVRTILSYENEEVQREYDLNYTDVFLVFDLDPHDSSVDMSKIGKMVGYYSDSTDNGMLYLNYPMMESLRHMKSLDDKEFESRCVKLKDVRKYKSIVNAECCNELKQTNSYDKYLLLKLTMIHLKKCTFIQTGEFRLPYLEEYADWGYKVFEKQMAKMRDEDAIYVVNTFALNIIDYRPSDYLKTNCSEG